MCDIGGAGFIDSCFIKAILSFEPRSAAAINLKGSGLTLIDRHYRKKKGHHAMSLKVGRLVKTEGAKLSYELKNDVWKELTKALLKR